MKRRPCQAASLTFGNLSRAPLGLSASSPLASPVTASSRGLGVPFYAKEPPKPLFLEADHEDRRRQNPRRIRSRHAGGAARRRKERVPHRLSRLDGTLPLLQREQHPLDSRPATGREPTENTRLENACRGPSKSLKLNETRTRCDDPLNPSSIC